jgi:hypothetical protein
MIDPRFVRVVALACVGCAALLVAEVASGCAAAARFRRGHVRSQSADRQPVLPDDRHRDAAVHGSEDGHPIDSYFEHTNTGPGPVIAGVQSFVQHDREFEDGLLIEDTFDYFAQDTTATSGTWARTRPPTNTTTTATWSTPIRAEPGARVSTAHCRASPCRSISTSGSTITRNSPSRTRPSTRRRHDALLDSSTVNGVTYHDVLQVLETTDLEPDEFEFKYYAPGVG